MYYIVESKKKFEKACEDLEVAVKNNGFGVLHIHNLGETLRSKGIAFEENCKVFEICNPKQAAKVLEIDIRLNMALPCRISVFTENKTVKIGMVDPEKMLSMMSNDPALQGIAREVETATRKMIDEAV